MELNIETVEILLLVAAIVAMAARRFKIPYTITLVLAGIALAISSLAPEINLSKELIFTIFLPPLIYEAALYIRWTELRRDLPVIVTFATVGVLLSAGITAIGMRLFLNWQWESAILFGVLIAATDPVSVIATFKDAGVHGRLRLLVEAESLFNDGTAAVAFVIAVAFATGGQISWFGTLGTLITMVLGGILCGALVAGGLLLLAGRTNDHLIEITLTTVAAYGSFLLAEHFHLSGVLATLTAGLISGNIGPIGSISDKGREEVESFWEYIAFVINSLIFILIGIREARQDFVGLLIPILIAIMIVIIGRAVAIYPISALFSRSALQIKKNHQHILFWGGLRGALALALALGLPPNIPHRDEIVTIAFGVVGFSVIVQGLTITPILRKLNEIAIPPSETKDP
jgi:CPA1 family monovalent cation:H+ antiporter